ncbi:MAG: hypothetical protein ACKVU1_03330 [bacterium]
MASDRAGGVEPGVVAALVPVYLSVPAVEDGDEQTGIGFLVRIAIRARPFNHESSPVRWTGPDQKPLQIGLRPLEAVSQDALGAAVSCMAVRQDRRSLWRGVDAPARPLRLVFDCSVTESEAPVVGDSAGLGIAVAMLSALDAAENRGAGSFPRADWAWTGRVLPSGEVAAVDEASLRAKVRAAFYAGLAGITVAKAQTALARTALPSGAGSFAIVGAASVRESLDARESVRRDRLPADSIREPIAKKRLPLRTALAVLTMIILAGVAGVREYTNGSTQGPTAEIRDNAIDLSYQGGAPARTYRDPAGRAFAYTTVASHLPGDPDGEARLVIVVRAGFGLPGSVEVRDLKDFSAVWEYFLVTSGLPVEPRKSHREIVYNGKAGLVEDLDSDGDNEIVVSFSAHPYSQSVLSMFDDDPVPAGAVLHNGHIEALQSIDCDSEGPPEVVAAGYHAASDGAAVLLLRASDFRSLKSAGSAVATDSTSTPDSAAQAPTWDANRQPCLAHFVFPVLPRIAEELGVQAMHVSTRALEIVTAPGEPPTIRLAVGVPLRDPLSDAYLIGVAPPRTLVNVSPNAPLIQVAESWIDEGRTSVNFTSREVIDEWQSTFRVYTHVQLGPVGLGSDEGSSLQDLDVVAAARTVEK